jgi:hypothetical protein
MRAVLAATVLLILAVAGPLNPFAWWNVLPLVVAVVVLGRTSGPARTAAAAFAAVAGGMLGGFHVAWQMDFGRVASGSSTAGLSFVFLPVIATVLGLAAAVVGAGAHLLWRRAGLRSLPRTVTLAWFGPVLLGSGALLFAQLGAATTWPAEGIQVESPLLERELALETRLPGGIRWIGEVGLDSGERVVAVAGQADLVLLDSELRPLQRIETVSVAGRVFFGLNPEVLSDVDGLRVFQGGGGSGAVRVRELDGSIVWDFEESAGDRPRRGIVLPPAPGRALRYAVAARDGVYGFDASLIELWRDDAGAMDLSAAEHEGVLTLLARRAAGGLTLLDENGRVTGSMPARRGVRFAKAVAWPDEVVVFAHVGARLVVLNISGAVLQEWDLNPAGRDPAVTTARFGVPGDPHLVALATSPSGTGRAVLTVFDAAGSVVHREVVARSTGLHALRRPAGDVLLFGDGLHRVWSLAAAELAP